MTADEFFQKYKDWAIREIVIDKGKYRVYVSNNNGQIAYENIVVGTSWLVKGNWIMWPTLDEAEEQLQKDLKTKMNRADRESIKTAEPPKKQGGFNAFKF